jgi:glycogen operon protein
LREFTREVISLRQNHSILRRDSWHDGTVVTWYNPDGSERGGEQWADARSRTMALRLSRDDSDEEGWKDVLILFNPHDASVPFVLPQANGKWTAVLTTTDPDVKEQQLDANEYVVADRSVVLLRSD